MIYVSNETQIGVLERIKKGDMICYKNGKSGEVVSIQVLQGISQRKYFYKIKNNGVVFIIK